MRNPPLFRCLKFNYTIISYRVNGLQCAVPDPSPSVSFS